MAVCALDGMQSLYSGVGVVVRSFVRQAEHILTEAFADTGHTWTLSCASGSLLDDAVNLRPDLRAATRRACAHSGGTFTQLPSLTDGSDVAELFVGPDPSRPVDQWAALSTAAADWLLDLAAQHDVVLALLHDTPFAAVAGRLSDLDDTAGNDPPPHTRAADRIMPVWVPHSLGVVFPDEMSAQRREFEARGIADIIERDGCVGYVSDYYENILAGWDGMRPRHLVPFRNVIDTAAYQRPPSEQALAVLRKIPADARLTFSWGRCKPQKGFDALLEAYRGVLAARPDDRDHLLLVAPTATTEPSYLATVSGLISRLPVERVTVCHDFDETLPFAALRDSRLDTVVLASRFEAFGLVAAEALEFAHPAARIVHSPIPTFETVLGGDPRAVRLAGVNPESIAAALLDEPRPVTRTTVAKQGPERDGLGAAFVHSQAKGVRACLDLALDRGAVR